MASLERAFQFAKTHGIQVATVNFPEREIIAVFRSQVVATATELKTVWEFIDLWSHAFDNFQGKTTDPIGRALEYMRANW